MGTMQHHTAIAVTWGYDEASTGARQVMDALRAEVEERFGAPALGLLVGPVDFLVNFGETYLVLPDGSKEGWAESDAWDELRARFVDLMEPHARTLIISVGDNGEFIEHPLP